MDEAERARFEEIAADLQGRTFTEAQIASWKNGPVNLTPPPRSAVPDGDDSHWTETPSAIVKTVGVHKGWRTIDEDRAVAEELAQSGERPPVAALLGLPLVVARTCSYDSGDNQPITYLMIDAVTGFAPARWQSKVGACTVLRSDGGHYTKGDHSHVHDYFDMLLDMWPEGTPTEYLNPRTFQEFVRDREQDPEYCSTDGCPTTLAPLVRLRGLSSEALNGCKGFRGAWVAAASPEAKGRFKVYLDNGRDVKVKPENIEYLPDAARSQP